MKYNPQVRIRLISAIIFLVAIFFGIRLFFLQIIKGDQYDNLASRQYIGSANNFFNRGTIYFSDKDGNLVPAATLKQSFVVTGNPQLILDVNAVYKELFSVLPDLNKDDFLTRLGDQESKHQIIASDLDAKTADKIRDLNLRGIFIDKVKERHYPTGNTASHVLGFLASDGDNYAGRYGLEYQFDNILSRDEVGSFASFFSEAFLGFGKAILNKEGKEADLILTIDPVVQKVAEDELIALTEKWNTSQAGVIFMDPNTGEIIAMAALPDFNPGESVEDISVLPNPLIEKVYEMGSVVKALTMSVGLDSGVVNPATTYYDAGFLTLDSRTITNYDGRGRGTVNMQEVLNQSLNTGAAFVAQKVGNARFADYFTRFGLGEKTGIDLPHEVSGLVSNLHSPRSIELATASYGQGIAVSPIQIVRAFAALGNGGKLVWPHVVKEIRYEDGANVVTQPKVIRQVLSKKTSEDITSMLVKVVDDALNGGKYSLPHYSMAAKTGTAQIADPNGGGYYDDRYLHSFFGYFPAYEPRFVGFMYIIHPKGVRYASETLSEPFMNLSNFLLNYYEVPPDR